jgi:hypothetical protein
MDIWIIVIDVRKFKKGDVKNSDNEDNKKSEVLAKHDRENLF